MPPVSSTDVRARLAEGRSVEGLLDVRVAGYIHAHGLYGARR
jgi:nicotinic acid mononucleotide adenylyltransferase